MIRAAIIQDAASIARIYNYYVLNSTITFEEHAVPVPEIAVRMGKVQSHSLPYLVAEDDGRLLGFTCADFWKDRSAYRFTVESTVYIDPESKGKGWGSHLYESLLRNLRSMPVHAVIGIIALPNPSSVVLHEKFGFKKVAHLEEVGWKFEKRIDVGYWQLIL